MRLALVVAGVCAICRIPPRQHERCAVCEASNQVVRVCSFCCDWHKRNKIDWNEKKIDFVVGDEGSSAKARPMRDAQTATRRRGRPRSAAIDHEVLPRLRRLNRRERVTVARIDLEGRRRGTYQRWEWVSRREIARRAGCSHASVDRRHRDYAIA